MERKNLAVSPVQKRRGRAMAGIQIKFCKDYTVAKGKVAYVEKDDSDKWGLGVECQLPPGSLILRCSICVEPAVTIDYLWPHMSEHNRCDKHKL